MLPAGMIGSSLQIFSPLLRVVRTRSRGAGKQGPADAGKTPNASPLSLLQAFSVLPWPNATEFAAAAGPAATSFR